MALTDEQHIEFEQWLTQVTQVFEDRALSLPHNPMRDWYDGHANAYATVQIKLKELT